jgi:hypothetical protein
VASSRGLVAVTRPASPARARRRARPPVRGRDVRRLSGPDRPDGARYRRHHPAQRGRSRHAGRRPVRAADRHRHRGRAQFGKFPPELIAGNSLAAVKPVQGFTWSPRTELVIVAFVRRGAARRRMLAARPARRVICGPTAAMTPEAETECHQALTRARVAAARPGWLPRGWCRPRRRAGSWGCHGRRHRQRRGVLAGPPRQTCLQPGPAAGRPAAARPVLRPRSAGSRLKDDGRLTAAGLHPPHGPMAGIHVTPPAALRSRLP